MRLAGHALIARGRAYVHPRCLHCQRDSWGKRPPGGHGCCECGALSLAHEATNAARQKWHRQHKAALAGAA